MAKNLDGDASVVHVIVVVVVDVNVDTFFRGVGKAALDLFFFLERDSEDFVSWQKIGPSKKTDFGSNQDVSGSFQFRI